MTVVLTVALDDVDVLLSSPFNYMKLWVKLILSLVKITLLLRAHMFGI